MTSGRVSRDSVFRGIRPGAGFETGGLVEEKSGAAAVERNSRPSPIIIADFFGRKRKLLVPQSIAYEAHAKNTKKNREQEKWSISERKWGRGPRRSETEWFYDGPLPPRDSDFLQRLTGVS